jgi:NADP-dependent 3-hydroxy acid dehydrogenase YdfG
MMRSLAGKRALVAGGSEGIGRAIAIALSQAGAQLQIVARREAPLLELTTAIGAVPVRSDLSKIEEMGRVTASVEELWGGLDILVLSSGQYASGTVAAQPANVFDAMLRANVLGPLELVRRLLPLLIKSQGDIVFINSLVTRVSNLSGRAHFAAGYHALKAISAGLRDEVNDLGVRVLTVFPGKSATPRQERIHADMGAVYHPSRLLQPEDVASVVVCALTLPETAEMTDVYVRPRFKS